MLNMIIKLNNMIKEITDKLTKFIRDELANGQVNKENNSAEYLLGKNEAYSKVLSLISKILKE
tara:strand:- start:533 stop:721 length:189 start_codon:yes stop_codon:yes gene_type:complete